MLKVKFDVTLWGFGSNGMEIRTVTTPDQFETDEVRVGHIFSALNQIYHYGQNDFQPKQMRSVSVSDVIQFGDGYYLVCSMGFRKVVKGYKPTELEMMGIASN